MIEPTRQTDAWNFCERILVEVSRSFALIIPECPDPIDRALCVGYLLCRIADTIEDEPSLTDSIKASLYDKFLAVVDQPDSTECVQTFVQAWPAIEFSEPGYGELVRGTGLVAAAYGGLPEAITTPIRTCVHDMVAGMRATRPAERHGGVQFLCCDLAQLDDYCHIVAGTVGIMSTELFGWRFAQTQPSFRPTAAWREQGRRLGLGLQMTNIIKDCRVDASRGVSFIPADYVRLNADGYSLSGAKRAAVFMHAIAHLDAGLAYTLTVPRNEDGIRRFLLGSLLPAIATLEVAATSDAFHPKITREKMTEILELIVTPATTNEAVQSWYDQHRSRTLAALPET